MGETDWNEHIPGRWCLTPNAWNNRLTEAVRDSWGLAVHYSVNWLEAACSKATTFTIIPSDKGIKNILDTGNESMEYSGEIKASEDKTAATQNSHALT